MIKLILLGAECYTNTVPNTLIRLLLIFAVVIITGKLSIILKSKPLEKICVIFMWILVLSNIKYLIGYIVSFIKRQYNRKTCNS